MSEQKSMKEIAEEMGVFEQRDRPDREKIQDIVHPRKPCFKDYPCPVPNWGACRECNEQIDQILALFTDIKELKKEWFISEREIVIGMAQVWMDAKVEEAKREEKERMLWEFENWIHIWARELEEMPEWKELIRGMKQTLKGD